MTAMFSDPLTAKLAAFVRDVGIDVHATALAEPTFLPGLDIRCGDDVHRFLPLATAVVRDDEITILSPLVLRDEDEFAFYQARAFALATLRGKPVDRAGRREGALHEIVLRVDGTLVELVVDDDRRIPFGETVRIDLGSRSAA